MRARTRCWTITLAFMAFALCASSLYAQDSPTPEGHWEGAIVVPGGELGINVDLVLDGESWTGDISIPLQQTEDFPLSEVTVVGNAIRFMMADVPGNPVFEGTISDNGRDISGSFIQGGQNMTFNLTRQ